MKKRKLFLALALFAMTQTWAQTEWTDATSLPAEAGSYKLMTDVTLSETWEVPAGETTLDLNDHMITRTFTNDNQEGTVIFVDEGITLTIEDNAASKTTRYWERGTYKEWTNPQTSGSGDYKTVGGCITGGRGDNVDIVDGKLNFRGRIAVTASSEVFTIVGNVKTSSKTYPAGGGIVNGGTLNLNGGNVVGNRVVSKTSFYGGGIVNGGTMVIGEGAAVLGNAGYSVKDPIGDVPGETDFSTVFAGGLLNGYSAKSFVNNGRIDYNHIEVPADVENTQIKGGGVCQASLTSFTNNGSISYNTASCSAVRQIHGIGLCIMGEFNKDKVSAINNGTISDNDYISGLALGGGVVVNYGTFTNGADGVIARNRALAGGGVSLGTTAVFTNAGTISDNTASYYGGGVVVNTTKAVNFNAGTKITGNVVTGDVTGTYSTDARCGYGGGIYAASKPFTINSGSGTVDISGNQAANGGAGIYLNNAVLTLRSNATGKLTLTGNTLSGGTTASNVLLYGQNARIKIYNANSIKNAGTKIGVGIRKTATDYTFEPTCGVVTTDYSKHSTTALERFQLDEALYAGTFFDIYKNSDNEVEIGLPVNDENVDNSGRLSKYDGEPVSVKIGRRVIGDGYYNTLSLPFDVDNATLKKRFGSDVVLKKMTGAELSGSELQLTMNFTDASSIEAGVPYLIKVSQDVVDPTFTGVVIKNTPKPVETELCSFVPVFSQTRLENNNKKILFLDAENTLTWPSSEKYTADFRGLRCYFLLKNEVGAGIGSAKTFRLVFDGETTVIENVNVNANDNGILYNLQGQRVNKAVNGIYIKNGKKFVK